MIKREFTKENYSLLKKLEKEGYLIVKHINNNLKIENKTKIKFSYVSKPKRKIFKNWKEISKGYKQGLGTVIIRTTEGYKTDLECIKEKLGGRVIMKVF